VAAFHWEIPVVDLVVGTVLFRRDFLERHHTGHVDLSRLREGGVDLVGLTVATRFPDLRGTLSTPHFRSLGIAASPRSANMTLAEAFVRRIERWCEGSGNRLALVGSVDGLPEARPPDRVAAFIGVQGGHVLDRDLASVRRLRALGIRMLAPAHVMDNELVGSNTGVRRHGLTGFGREVVRELEREGIVVDLAHMSPRGIRDALPLLARPFVLSHTGFRDLAGGRSRWRRYSPANRNLASEDARLVAEAGGVIGLSLSTDLLGGSDLAAAVRAFRFGAELVGVEHLAVGSDFDGGLQTVFDVTGLPLLTQGLLDGGFTRDEVATIMGGNALRVLREVLALSRPLLAR
jgi:membrane dipeptidase